MPTAVANSFLLWKQGIKRVPFPELWSINVLLDIADIEASSTADTSSPPHEFLEEDVIPESDVDDAVDGGEDFQVAVELAFGPWEPIENDSILGFSFFYLFLDNSDYDFVTDESS